MLRAKKVFKAYYQLSKPGIIYANVFTAIAGYIFASEFDISPGVLLGLVGGLTLVIAGACAANNYLDRGIDVAMKRTSKRALVTGVLSGRQALIYAVIVAVLGFALLLFTQNMLTTILALVAYIDYVVLYGYSKRKSIHGTLVGTISGSIPLVMGYTAVTNSFDAAAVLLFVLFAAWQMAHFYAIAIYRLDDYKAAKIPVWPAVRGVAETRRLITGYIAVFIVMSIALADLGYIGWTAGIVLALAGLAWFIKALRLQPLDATWGKQIFLFSLKVMLVMSAALAFGPLLP